MRREARLSFSQHTEPPQMNRLSSDCTNTHGLQILTKLSLRPPSSYIRWDVDCTRIGHEVMGRSRGHDVNKRSLPKTCHYKSFPVNNSCCTRRQFLLSFAGWNFPNFRGKTDCYTLYIASWTLEGGIERRWHDLGNQLERSHRRLVDWAL